LRVSPPLLPFLLLGCDAAGSPCCLPAFFFSSAAPRNSRLQRHFLAIHLVLFLADLLAIALACQRFLHSLFLAWFQVKRMALDLLDDVFGLHLALEAAQGILKGFSFLNSYFCQREYTSKQANKRQIPEYLSQLVFDR